MDQKDMKQDKAIVKKALKMHDAQEHKGGKGTDLSKLKKGGKVKAKSKGKSAPAKSSVSRRGDGIATKGKTKGKMR